MYRLEGPIEDSADPISPKIDLILMLGLIGGLTLGVMIALVRGNFTRTLVPDEINLIYSFFR